MESQGSSAEPGHQLAAELGMTRGRDERWSRFFARVADAFGVVLLLVLTTYALASLIAFEGWTAVVLAASLGATGVLALISSRAKPRLIQFGIVSAALSVVFAAVAAITDSTFVLGLGALSGVVLLVFAVLEVLAAVISEQQVGFRTILGAISVYVMLGLLFTFVYAGVDWFQSGPFFGAPTGTGDFVFFSITTLTTTGYGNLVPAGQPGRMLAGFEMLIGQIFLVTLIAGLVSLWRPGSWRRGSR